jgi:hypothetical protein
VSMPHASIAAAELSIHRPETELTGCRDAA